MNVVSFRGIRIEPCPIPDELLEPLVASQKASNKRSRGKSHVDQSIADDDASPPNIHLSTTTAVSVRLLELQLRRCRQRRFELPCISECSGQRLYDLVAAWTSISHLVIYTLAGRPDHVDCVVEKVLGMTDTIEDGRMYYCNAYAPALADCVHPVMVNSWVCIDVMAIFPTGRILQVYLPVVIPLAFSTADELLRQVAMVTCRTHECAAFFMQQAVYSAAWNGEETALAPFLSEDWVPQAASGLLRFFVVYSAVRVGETVNIVLQPRQGPKVHYKGAVVSKVYLQRGLVAFDAACGDSEEVTGVMHTDLALF